MRDGLLYNMFLMLARRSPMLLLALGGSIFAILRWKRHPRVSIMTVSALVIYLIDAVLFQIFLYYFPVMIRNMEFSGKTIDWLYFFVFFFQDFVFAAIIVLLVAAAFSQRKTTPAAGTA